MKTAQEIFDQLNSIDENVRIEAKRASYIAGTNFVNGNASGENSNASGENSNASGENSNASGEMSRASGEMSRATEEMSRATGEKSRATGEKSRATGEMSRATEEMSRAIPEDLLERCNELKKWESSEKIRNMIIELCTYTPLSLNDIAKIINRKASSLRYHYVNSLIKSGELFYTIPEMLNHPDQKYTTVKK